MPVLYLVPVRLVAQVETAYGEGRWISIDRLSERFTTDSLDCRFDDVEVYLMIMARIRQSFSIISEHLASLGLAVPELLEPIEEDASEPEVNIPISSAPRVLQLQKMQ